MSSSNRRRQSRLHQSSFLRLSREIRDLIYHIAFVNSTSINFDSVNYAESNSEINFEKFQQRRLKFIRENDKRVNRMFKRQNHIHQKSLLIFRLQNDFRFVRKQLITQFLQICRQIYNETADYYWKNNIWRFFDDDEWEILWKLLLSIEFNARSRVHKLNVLIFFSWTDDHALKKWKNWYIKNQSKLHMIKLWQIEITKKCYNMIFDLWMREKTLRMLNFLIFADYIFYFLNVSDFSWNEALLMKTLSSKIKVIVEIEEIAFDKTFIFARKWNLIALCDNCFRFNYDEWTSNVITQSIRIWKFENDLIKDLIRLFNIEKFQRSANDDRIHTSKKWIDVKKKLNEFESCVVISKITRCHCWWCNFRESRYRRIS